MAKKLKPSNDMVLILDLPRTTTLDGIEMPDNMRQQEMVFGRVVSVGPKVSKDETREGDVVCYGPFAGKTVPIDGVEFRILKEGQIEGRIVDED